ncbi:MspA family porin [Williamsia deligens]|uniref:MspA family porin n=1 Tax=Williamsia deligens TaxID=321325 RepID=A0ABW3G7U9_9NOCA|nr:MspA family porin [Williamsia deligens]MCP2192560.1 MspA protein [Williamsia deligens]
MNTSTKRRAGAVAGLAAVSAVALSSLGAGGAAAGPLPGGFTSQTLVDGTKVTVRLFDESVDRRQQSTVALPTSRNVLVSGKVLVTVGGSGATGGAIDAGYIVGCQLNFGAGANAQGGLSTEQILDAAKAAGTTGDGADLSNNSIGSSFELSPGKATAVSVVKNGDDTGFEFKGTRAGLAYSQEQFRVDGCAGFAEAKAYVKVKVSTDAVDGYVTLVGKPFSIG